MTKTVPIKYYLCHRIEIHAHEEVHNHIVIAHDDLPVIRTGAEKIRCNSLVINLHEDCSGL